MTSASGSPAFRAQPGGDSSPASYPRKTLSRMSSMQQMQRVNTSFPQMFSVTPASAHGSSSVAASPYQRSLQSSPATSQSHLYTSNNAEPGPLELPESVVPPSQINGKESQPGLIRKLSQSAKGHVSHTRQALRRKTSSSQQGRRDESTGPITRRRSDSKTVTATANGNVPEQTPFDSLPMELTNGLHMFDAMSITSEPATIPDKGPEGQAPSIPEKLVAGSPLNKIGKNRSDITSFFLDVQGSRVTWRGRVSTKSFQIDNIKSIRRGEDAASYQQETPGEPVNPELCFTINYAASDSSNRAKTLHLQATRKDDVDLWIDTLESLSKHRESLMTSMMGTKEREAVIRLHWDKEMHQHHMKHGIEQPDRLDLPAIQSLCGRLHIHCHAKDLENAFILSATTRSGSLDYGQFKSFLRRLRERKDLRKLFDSLKDENNEVMTPDRFMAFLVDSQGFDLGDEAVKTIWNEKVQQLVDVSSQPGTPSQDEIGIDFASFSSFMASDDCHVYTTAQKSRPRFTKSLNEYFISSSHNTYLTGWQVAGSSSSEAYITAIRHGCRCVEIDCWDGAEGPRVTHGHTGTSSVPFADCIYAINRCAFDVTPYPLIISLEVHCNPEQQRKMIQTMKDIFGEKLLLQPVADHATTLPSPEELKHKILVKVKAVEPHADLSSLLEDSLTVRKRSASSPYRKAVAPTSAASIPPVPLLNSPSMTSPSDTIYSPTDRSVAPTSASSAGEESDVAISSPIAKDVAMRPSKVSKITADLAGLGIYMQGYTLRDPRDLLFQKYNHIFSINENRAMELSRPPETKALFEDHNSRYLCRVYPKNRRVQSSNFDPNTFWRRGVQMVALNWQTFDAHMQMHHAMFAAGTDRYGYVLKPEYLRMPRAKGVDFETRRKLPRFNMSFSVRVMSAQQLPRPQNFSKTDALNPFIEVQMFSAEDRARGIAIGSGGQESSPNDYHGIGSPYKRHTNIVRGNGYNPQYDETIELSLETKYPELVFVRFIVLNSADGKAYEKNCRQVAVFTAKLSSLQKGYRHLPLYNGNGEEFIFSTLFCQIKKHDVRLSADSLQDIADRTPRQSLLRGMLSRGMSGDRGRERSSSID